MLKLRNTLARTVNLGELQHDTVIYWKWCRANTL